MSPRHLARRLTPDGYISTTYQVIDIVRIAGVVTILINGTQVQSVAFATSVSDIFFTTSFDGSGAVGDVRVDDVSLTAFR